MSDEGVKPFDPDDPDAGTHLDVRRPREELSFPQQIFTCAGG
tara:strand:- start:6562 stop:6687 length:126 start_codon:yes stop_codon:yes gene_type:complete